VCVYFNRIYIAIRKDLCVSDYQIKKKILRFYVNFASILDLMDYFLTMYLIHFHSLKLWFLEYAFIESAKDRFDTL